MTIIELFKIEERVYLRINNMQKKKKSKKLMNKSIRSFQIMQNTKKLSYELDLFKEM
jgi:actin-related protein